MFTYLSRRGTRPRTTMRLRRITAALAALTGGLLALAAAVPAASAATAVIPDPGGASGPVPATVPTAPVQVIAAGMPGWQITLIAAAAALVAATAGVFFGRARASRRSASATG
jgi:glucose/arabinose dehydrogenase